MHLPGTCRAPQLSEWTQRLSSHSANPHVRSPLAPLHLTLLCTRWQAWAMGLTHPPVSSMIHVSRPWSSSARPIAWLKPGLAVLEPQQIPPASACLLSDIELVFSLRLSCHIPPSNFPGPLLSGSSCSVLEQSHTQWYTLLWVRGNWTLEVYFQKNFTLHDCTLTPIWATTRSNIVASWVVPPHYNMLWKSDHSFWWQAVDGFQQTIQQVKAVLHIKLLKHEVTWRVNFFPLCYGMQWEDTEHVSAMS